MTSMIPYTHWAYFPDETSARECAVELPDFVTRVRWAADGVAWLLLLLAGRDVEVGRLVERHGEVRAVVERHGGVYDGGECTYDAGVPVADPMLVEPHDDF